MTKLKGNCEDDCQKKCAYPGQFSECDTGASNEGVPNEQGGGGA